MVWNAREYDDSLDLSIRNTKSMDMRPQWHPPMQLPGQQQGFDPSMNEVQRSMGVPTEQQGYYPQSKVTTQ